MCTAFGKLTQIIVSASFNCTCSRTTHLSDDVTTLIGKHHVYCASFQLQFYWSLLRPPEHAIVIREFRYCSYIMKDVNDHCSDAFIFREHDTVNLRSLR